MSEGQQSRRVCVREACGLAAILSGAPVAAQTPAATSPAQPPVVLAPGAVTSRRVEEPIQEGPFSVTVVTGEDLRDQTIRGIGSSSALISPSITDHIDGVPLPPRAFDIRFLDLSRLEVLRGRGIRQLHPASAHGGGERRARRRPLGGAATIARVCPSAAIVTTTLNQRKATETR